MKQENVVTAQGGFGRVIAVRLKPGTDVLVGLREACERNGIKNGVIVSGLGSLATVTPKPAMGTAALRPSTSPGNCWVSPA